jgi:hypothetical protein
MLLQDRRAQDAGEARQLGQRGLLDKMQISQHSRDHDDDADNIKDAGHLPISG